MLHFRPKRRLWRAGGGQAVVGRGWSTRTGRSGGALQEWSAAIGEAKAFERRRSPPTHALRAPPAGLPSVTALDRDATTGLFPVEASDYLPMGTAFIYVNLVFQGGVGDYNDGYADNLELILSEYTP